jgi:hypothetical protein
MIQRQQTIWLLLAAIFSFLTFQFPFYIGYSVEVANGAVLPPEIDAASNFFLLVITGISIVLALITIFLYKDRKNQLRLAIGGVILSLLLLFLYYTAIKKTGSGHFALTSLFAFAIPITYFLAARGIWKDQKLVKSLDKLR